MSAEVTTKAVDLSTQLGAESSIGALEIAGLIFICGVCVYYLYKSWFGAAKESKCGGCGSKGSCGAASLKADPKSVK